MVDWENLRTESSENSFEQELVDAVITCALVQHVKEATRYDPDTESSLLDLILTHYEDDVANLHHMPPLGKSDHAVLTFDFHITASHEDASVQSRPNVWKANIPDIMHSASLIDWTIDPESSIETAWNTFRKSYLKVTTPHIPWTIPKGPKNSPPWFSREVRILLRKKRKTWDRFRLLGTDESKSQYRKARNTCASTLRKSRKLYEEKLVKESIECPKRLYSYINQRTRRKGNIPALWGDSTASSLVEDDFGKAQAFSNYFSNVYTIEAPFSSAYTDPPIHTLDSVTIKELDVFGLLNKLDVGKSTGPDELHPRLLKELSNFVANPLSTCFNLSVTQGRLPKDWKNAIVSPVFKTGTKHKPENYRPVSLTSVVVKILEKIIRKELFKYLDKNRILSEKQHGFRIGYSCLTNLLVARESWCALKDQKLPVDVAFIDFSKAFDKVPHNRLLYKLRHVGIGGNLLMWIKDFLVGRQQRVRVNSKLSSWETVLSGVPQGTVLGPVLFLLYVNDLPCLLSSSVLLYADDVKIWRTIRCKSDSLELQNDLKKLSEWSQTWQLPINTSKCVVMHIGHQGTDTYTMNNTELPVVQTYNDLGVIVSQDLKTTAHCRAIAAKSFRTLWSIRRAFSHVDTKTFLTLYTVFVRPKLEYCIQAASPCLKKDRELLEKVQRMATKLVPAIAKLPYESRLAKLNLFPLSYRRTRGDLITVYKLLSDKFAPNMPSFFLSSKTDNLRGHSKKVHKPRTNYLSADYRLSHRIINEWNSLPQHVVEAPSVDSFKRRLDQLRDHHCQD
ncbi:unnamed protein product [Schistosoma bovis]|nr:unnamed protein product [Schistosoma bovis]